ncbi:hypothetical protein Trydic_g19758 [Trypoxylus dichotomus]
MNQNTEASFAPSGRTRLASLHLIGHRSHQMQIPLKMCEHTSSVSFEENAHSLKYRSTMKKPLLGEKHVTKRRAWANIPSKFPGRRLEQYDLYGRSFCLGIYCNPTFLVNLDQWIYTTDC